MSTQSLPDYDNDSYGSNRICDFQMLVVEDYEHYNGATAERPTGSVA